MKRFAAVVERDAETGLLVGWVPGIVGAHTQAANLEALRANLREVMTLLESSGPIEPQREFLGKETVEVG